MAKSNVVLIGFMASGKTAVGRRLALRLGREFLDTDAEVERVTGLSVNQIFARYGEARFRSEEALVVRKAAQRRRVVIATGGGVPLNPANMMLLRRSGLVVRLEARPEVILARVGRKGGTRPLLIGANPAERIRQLLAEREPVYRQADLTVDTSDLEPGEVVERIVASLEGLPSWQK